MCSQPVSALRVHSPASPAEERTSPIIRRGFPTSMTMIKITPQTFSEAPFKPDNLFQVCLVAYLPGEDRF